MGDDRDDVGEPRYPFDYDQVANVVDDFEPPLYVSNNAEDEHKPTTSKHQSHHDYSYVDHYKPQIGFYDDYENINNFFEFSQTVFDKTLIDNYIKRSKTAKNCADVDPLHSVFDKEEEDVIEAKLSARNSDGSNYSVFYGEGDDAIIEANKLSASNFFDSSRADLEALQGICNEGDDVIGAFTHSNFYDSSYAFLEALQGNCKQGDDVIGANKLSASNFFDCPWAHHMETVVTDVSAANVEPPLQSVYNEGDAATAVTLSAPNFDHSYANYNEDEFWKHAKSSWLQGIESDFFFDDGRGDDGGEKDTEPVLKRRKTN